MKKFVQLVIACLCLAYFIGHLKDRQRQRHLPNSSEVVRHFQREVAPSQSRSTRPRPPRSLQQPQRVPAVEENLYVPISNIYNLQSRGYSDEEISSIVLQNELIKKDPRLAYNGRDIDDCNNMIAAYVERGVRENERYYLRRKLVEGLGQTNRSVLINRMRLVACLLGGEKGRGGMDPVFTPIREEAHRFSPYVVVLVEDYIRELETNTSESQKSRPVPEDFKEYVARLGDQFHNEHHIADIGRRQRGEIAKELYALRALLKDLRVYYGERIADEGAAGGANFEVIFSEPGSFRSELYTRLQDGVSTMSNQKLAQSFLALGLELRRHMSALRDRRDGQSNNRRYHDPTSEEEVHHLQKLNELTATLSGLFASERGTMSPVKQAGFLVDLLFLEGLYSNKERKRLKEELSERPQLGSGYEDQTESFYAFLNYMSGLAYKTMDETLGEAARAFAQYTDTAETYIEIEARKSALQILGQLQHEVFQEHRSILGGRQEIHLAGTAEGTLRVFRTPQEMKAHVRQDPYNGGQTLWVLKSGLTMPNEASFAAIIQEDPIMKGSHYDGYARSRKPPIPLLQVPGAVDQYAGFHGKSVRLTASRGATNPIDVQEAALASATTRPASVVGDRVRLPSIEKASPQLVEIQAPRDSETLRTLRKEIGAKAANYAFLRSHLPLNQATGEEHIYPGFAIPFSFYQEHVISSAADEFIDQVAQAVLDSPGMVPQLLATIRQRILSAPVSNELLGQILQQIDGRLKQQHRVEEQTVKLRFRSSSNAEDNQDFSGAGLYESHFAFFTYDNPFGDTRSQQMTEMGRAALAIKKVWASVWKPEAFWARERAGLAQDSVRMGILVHPSYRKEESTGVIYYYGKDDIEMAAHEGNENVQNPSIAGLTPELHRFLDETHERDPSSCFALSGEEVLSKNDRKKMMRLLEVVVPKFRELYAEEGVIGVDVEFKVLERKIEGAKNEDVVYFKQIRPLAARAEMH